MGVETAKNLILSNVGGVWVWDPEATVRVLFSEADVVLGARCPV